MQPLKEQEKTQLWLSQFDHRPGDRELAERLLDSINYCPLNEFKTSLTTLIKRSLPLKEPRHSSLSVSYKKPRPSTPGLYKEKKTYSPRSKKKHVRAYGAAAQAIQSLT